MVAENSVKSFSNKLEKNSNPSGVVNVNVGVQYLLLSARLTN